jgi:Domain of unknown function (DUF4149)
MTNIARFVQVFALGTWVGAIIYFVAAVAPGAFTVLASRDEAGALVGYTLTRLHQLGVVAAIVYLVATVGLARSAKGLWRPEALLVVAMLLLTLASQDLVRPRMAALRAQMGSIEATPAESPLLVQFDRLHRASVQLEGAVLLLGVAGLFLTAIRKPV